MRRIVRKWRPSLGQVVGGALLGTLGLSFVGLVALRLTGPLIEYTLCRQVAQLPGLVLRGLMAIPEPCDDFEAQRRPFRLLRELFDALRGEGLALDTLSMGMSHDLEAAVAEGATIVRVGTAIFGARDYSKT